MIPAVSSSFDIASWFLEESKKQRAYLSPLKIQRMLYLAQAFFAGNHDGRALMPAVFVVSEVGPIEPNLFRVFEHEQPTVSVRELEPEIDQFLHSIWKKYGGTNTSGTLEEKQLLEFLAERLVRYKLPRTFEWTDSPLRDDAGKVRRGALQQIGRAHV